MSTQQGWLRGKPVQKLKRSFRRLSNRALRRFTALCITAAALLVLRSLLFTPHTAALTRQHLPPMQSRLIHHPVAEPNPILYRSQDHDCPLEEKPPNPALYGRGTERCFALGMPDDMERIVTRGEPASFWQVNSRALCYSPRPVCLYGRHLETVLTFESRGAGACGLVRVSDDSRLDMRHYGANESCAAFRSRQVVSMYGGRENYANYKSWLEYADKRQRQHSNKHHKSIQWESKFAIVVPRYSWSYNICHYNRIWNYVIYVIRHLHLFVPNADAIRVIDVKFRAGYNYSAAWPAGIRKATLPLLEQETGKKIAISKLRHNYHNDFQCIHSGILLGREGRVDSFPWLNDSAIYDFPKGGNDAKWPIIPHGSLWFREAVYRASRLPSVGEISGPGLAHFHSMPVPPRRVGILRRSPRSRRRLDADSAHWFDATVTELAQRHSFEVVELRFTKNMPLSEQVGQVRNLGVGVGIHGANLVNTVFMPPGGSLFEIFPFRYVRFYYAAGANSGLRYSSHEPLNGRKRNCSSLVKCALAYREALITLSSEDRTQIYEKLEHAFLHVVRLHQKFPSGVIPLLKNGNIYTF